MKACVLTREFSWEGEDVVGIFESLKEAAAYADEHGPDEETKGPWGDQEHIRALDGTTVLRHVERHRKYVDGEFVGYTDWAIAS